MARAGAAGGRAPRAALLVSARRITSREHLFLALADLLVRRGWGVDLLAAGPVPELRAAVPPPVSLLDVDPRWARWRLARPPHLLRIYASVPNVARYLRRARPDVLLATSIPPNLTALAAKLLARQPTRVVIRQSNSVRIPGSPRYDAIRRRPRDWLIPRLYPKADAVIAVSAGVADNLRLLTGIPDDKIHTIANAVPLARIQKLAREAVDHPWFVGGGPPVLLAVGRLVPKKDYPTLLRALALVRKRREARLVVLGEGPERAALEQLAGELGLDDAVSMPGFATNPFAHMARADLFVSSSISEGMASALIEALACGCPVVSTDCPSGPAEILQNETYGRLVSVGDIEALAAAILGSLDEAHDRDRLRARAAEFASDLTVERYLDLLLQVAKGADIASDPSARLRRWGGA